MSRLTDAIIQQNTGIAVGYQAPMLDPKYGGDFGWAAGYPEWISNQAYIRKNLIAILLETPTGFNYLPNPDAWVQTWKSMVETHVLSIDGLQSGIEVEFSEQAVGGGGQMQEDFTDSKVTRSNITMRWIDKYGNPFQKFLRQWITWLMLDPETKYPNFVTLTNRPTDQLADVFSSTILFIEPDAVFQHVQKAWLVTNMMPKNTGEIIGKKDMTQAGEQTSIDIPFTGICQISLGVDAFAQTILQSINITGANPQLRAPFIDAINPDVIAAPKGYVSSATDVATGALQVP